MMELIFVKFSEKGKLLRVKRQLGVYADKCDFGTNCIVLHCPVEETLLAVKLAVLGVAVAHVMSAVRSMPNRDRIDFVTKVCNHFDKCDVQLSSCRFLVADELDHIVCRVLKGNLFS